MQDQYQLEILERYPDITIIHHREPDGSLWATAKRAVLRGRNGRWEQAAEFPRSYPRDLFAFSRPSARVMRADKCNLYVNRHGKTIGIRAGAVYALKAGKMDFLFPIQGDCALHRSICEDEDGNIYLGEYFMNPERRAVHIWRIEADLSHWQPACRLNGVRHVHGIYPDPCEQGTLWATAGDFAGECYLLRSRDRFKSIEKIGDGTQTWRAVNLFFTPEHVCWLTDSNLERNHACRMRRKNQALEIGQPMDNSTWYGGSTRESLHVAFTTVEQGEGILSNESAVIVSQDAFHWQKVFGFKKDFWRPVKVFKYGVISCPSGEMNLEELYLSGEGLVGLDGCSLKVRIRKQETRA